MAQFQKIGTLCLPDPLGSLEARSEFTLVLEALTTSSFLLGLKVGTRESGGWMCSRMNE